MPFLCYLSSCAGTFNSKGAEVMADLVIQDLTNVVSELGAYLK